MEPREELDRLLADLKQHRDELVVKLHLGAAEAKELWEVMESRWGQLTAKAELLAGETGEAAAEVAEAAKLLAEEIEKGYERIRKLL
jgi:hypothetical protein